MMFDDFIFEDMRGFSLWDLPIEAVVGESLEAKNRDEVNQLLGKGWVLLHIYTLKYKENDAWRERPMAILGKPQGILSKKKNMSH